MQSVLLRLIVATAVVAAIAASIVRAATILRTTVVRAIAVLSASVLRATLLRASVRCRTTLTFGSSNLCLGLVGPCEFGILLQLVASEIACASVWRP